MQQSSLLLSPTLSVWIRELYTQARELHLADFKQWCFSSFQQLLRFDSGLWATRSDLHELRREHWVDDTCLFKQPDDFMANYVKLDALLGSQDPLNQFLISHPSQFYSIWDCCPKAQWYNNDYYLKHCRLFGVENAISALSLPRADSAISHVFSFYRADPNDEFSASETLLADFVLPNLIESFRINVLSTFRQTRRKDLSFRAVLDRFGEIMEAEEGFIELMQRKALLSNTRVNIPNLAHISATDQFEWRGVKLDIEFNEGLFYLEASEDSLLNTLTGREFQIIQLLSDGLSSKKIANDLTKNDPTKPIKANTVNTHLHSIYGKLNVSNKSAASAYFLTHAATDIRNS